jgi:nitrogen fixation/metabolism regulation signal transduction histidine kinase
VAAASRLTHERRVLLLAAAAALPAVAVAIGLLWAGDYSSKLRWTLMVVVVLSWILFTQALRERVVRPLQTVSNLLAAMREEDFSIRARGSRPDDPLGEVLLEVNALAETLREQRLGALEATALLSKVMAEIAVAVFAFDDAGGLRLVNRFGETLLGQPEPRLLGRSAEELGLAPFLSEEIPQIRDASFPGGSGRWEVRRSSFRQGGVPHQLLVLADVSRPLREEERQAWQRLIRVLGHELNNSLAPIQSIAGSLQRLAEEPDPPADWLEDLGRGLAIIGSRAESLSRFTTAYARLARLPPPRPAPLALDPLLRRVIGLDTSVIVRYLVGTPRAQARRAAALIDRGEDLGIPLVALVDTAHVLRTQYGVPRSDVVATLPQALA